MYASQHKCRVYVFECADASHLEMLTFLQEVAAKQKAAYIDIFPWETTCDDTKMMLVSLAMENPPGGKLVLDKLKEAPPIVCGWLVATYNPKYPKLGAYINKLSTRTPTDPTFGGVGKQLLQAVEDLGPDFIYLYPLSEKVSEFYAKYEYNPMKSGVKHMFKILKKSSRLTLPKVQSVVSNLNEVEQFKEDVKYSLSDAEYKRLMEVIKKTPKDEHDILVKAAMELFYKEEDEEVGRENIREWLNGIKGGRRRRR